MGTDAKLDVLPQQEVRWDGMRAGVLTTHLEVLPVKGSRDPESKASCLRWLASMQKGRPGALLCLCLALSSPGLLF